VVDGLSTVCGAVRVWHDGPHLPGAGVAGGWRRRRRGTGPAPPASEAIDEVRRTEVKGRPELRGTRYVWVGVALMPSAPPAPKLVKKAETEE